MHTLPECSDETELWSFVVRFCEPMSLRRRDSSMDVHVCVTPVNGKSKTSHISYENALWRCVISSRSVVRV